jgi:DNA-binding CsgD family transcriptional regulator
VSGASIVSVSSAAVLDVIESFATAAVGGETWDSSLQRMAAVTGSKCGQLIGLGADAAVPFNVLTGTAPEAAGEFHAVNGGDPRVNSRIRIGSQAGELTIVDEAAFTTAEDGRRSPAYGDFIQRHDIPYICLTPLLKQGPMLVGLAVIRDRKQGNISADQKAVFAAMAPHARTAVRMQMALAGKSLRLLLGALESGETAAFLCDGAGAVQEMTARAEAVVGSPGALAMRARRLRGRSDADNQALQTAIGMAATAHLDPLALRQSVLVLGRGAERLVVQVDALPATDWALAFAPRVLVVVRSASTRPVSVAVLLRAFDLTATEAAIALDLAAGHSREAIALARRVSLATVRQQIKAILQKAGVSCEAELILAIKALA